jgi:hypothetical protein
MSRSLLRRNQYAARSSINPVVESIMGCGTVYPTRCGGSRARGVLIEPGSRKRKGAGRLWRIAGLSVMISAALLFSSQLALAQFSQQRKLVGTEAINESYQGDSVSLSSDGNTAIVGGGSDNGGKGAAWVFTRKYKLIPTGHGLEKVWIWTQQKKLVGTGAIGNSYQGDSVSLSSDGNTAIVGGPYDDGVKGAAWVFTRSYKIIPTGHDLEKVWIWTQQKKLVGTEAIGHSGQGGSVSLSSDGNTAIVGAYSDNNYSGAAWVYTRSGGVWTQQKKLVGTEAIITQEDGWIGSGQGHSVSLSSDGNTAIVGGILDDGMEGAAWVFTRSYKIIPTGQDLEKVWIWTQQKKLVGTEAISGYGTGQGFSVSLSSDGNTAIVGRPADDWGKGAAWVFTRSGGVWTQQKKLVGTEAINGGGGLLPRLLGLALLRRQHGHRRRTWRQRGEGSCVGVHAQWRCLDPEKKAGRHGSDWKLLPRRLRLALLRRQHGHRRRTSRQRREGSCVGLCVAEIP